MKSAFMKSLWLAAMSLVITVSSCNYVDDDINIDPNRPVDVSVNLLLPSAITTYGFVLGGDFGRPTGIWLQYFAGVDRQHSGYEVYQLKEADVNTAWSNIYAGALEDLDIIEEKSAETGSPHYAGVAKILKAAIGMTLVDLFNDVPYSEALGGSDNLTPSFQEAASIYADALSSLQSAITDLDAATSTFSPRADDLIYGGDRTKWKALARTLIARNYLNRGAVDADNYASALTAVDGAIVTNATNALIPYEDNNPFYAFNADRGDVDAGKFMIDLLESLDDPRIDEYYALKKDQTEYRGVPAGIPPADRSIVATFGPAWMSASSPVALAMSYETKFIEAEAAFRTGALERAATAHNDAIKLSLAYYAITDTDYVADQASETAASISLEKIMTHKYIAMYPQVQAFSDWRRTGIPVLAPAAGQSQIATRFPYPSDERLFNSENYQPYAGTTVFDKVFWDR